MNDFSKSGQGSKFLFFWGHKEKPGEITKACLSQWYACVFEVDGVLYSSAEQFMMAEKARLMGDEAKREEILATDDPRRIRSLGRQVRNFDSKLWEDCRMEVVIRGNYAKFSQNEPLRYFLLKTGYLELVEASPFDTIWGIGMEESDPDVTDPTKWRGENLLGLALKIVRFKIKNDLKEMEIKLHRYDPSSNVSVALRYWNSGIGNMAKAFNGEDPMPDKSVCASAKSWRNEPMPEKCVKFPINVRISTSDMALIKRGHIPEAMEDHWFMYCDDNTIRYYRSWTGICIYIAEYEIHGDVTHIKSLCVNRDPEHYTCTDDSHDFFQFMAMLIDEYGGNARLFWNLALH